MIHIIKNYKWVLVTSLISIAFGLMTFLTFINQSFIPLNNLNIQILLLADLVLLVLFFIIIIRKTYTILGERKKPIKSAGRDHPKVLKITPTAPNIISAAKSTQSRPLLNVAKKIKTTRIGAKI